MKFNRKGKYVAVEFDQYYDVPLFVENHMLYTYKDIRWAIMEYEKFWQLNKDMVSLACS